MLKHDREPQNEPPCGWPNTENLYREYRLTLEQYVAMGERQNWTCACGRGFTREDSPVVDEEHAAPWRVRGLLHNLCNRRLKEWMTAYVKNPPAVEAIGEYVVPEACRRLKARRARWQRSTRQARGQQVEPVVGSRPPARTSRTSKLTEKLRRIV